VSAPAKDPICGKEVDPLRARAVGIFGGVTYYFCSPECKAQFKDPRTKPRPTTRELTPTTREPTPTTREPAPTTREPAPTVREPTPTTRDPAPRATTGEPKIADAPGAVRAAPPAPDAEPARNERTPSAPVRVATPPAGPQDDEAPVPAARVSVRTWAIVIAVLAVLVLFAAVVSLRK
jgi:YHS domain-containing protein